MDILKDIDLDCLEIAAGDRPTPGFIHNDLRPLEHIEIVCDCLKINEFLNDHGVGDKRFTAIRATHILEHFPYNDTVRVLLNWQDLLLPGGSIHIEVPNFSWQTRAHSDGVISDEEAVYYVYGEQNYDGNFHKAAFTEEIIRMKLRDAGFVNITVSDIGQVLIANANKP